MRTLAVIGLFAILGLAGAGVYFIGGYYNVAASAGELAVVDWLLARVRQSSIARHATDTPPATLEDAATVRAGARAYSVRGCAACHGAPGVAWMKLSEGLRPYPPDLKGAPKDRPPAELFWIIKHGIKFTGMPSFGAIEVPDPEIWSIVAFVKKLPGVSESDYKTWSAPPVVTPLPSR
jgi:mono/diheme cytochrome c family protein